MAASRSALVVTTGLISQREMRLRLSSMMRSSGFAQATVSELSVRESGKTRCWDANSSGTSCSRPAPRWGLSRPEEREAKGMPSCLLSAEAMSCSVTSSSSTSTSPRRLVVPRWTSGALASWSSETSPLFLRISPSFSVVLIMWNSGTTETQNPTETQRNPNRLTGQPANRPTNSVFLWPFCASVVSSLQGLLALEHVQRLLHGVLPRAGRFLLPRPGKTRSRRGDLRGPGFLEDPGGHEHDQLARRIADLGVLERPAEH